MQDPTKFAKYVNLLLKASHEAAKRVGLKTGEPIQITPRDVYLLSRHLQLGQTDELMEICEGGIQSIEYTMAKQEGR